MLASPSDKRRQPRFVVEGVHGKMTFASQVEVLNMSLSGAALKVDRRLNIGSEYLLKLEVQNKTISVKGVVVWSALDEMRKGPRGDNVPVYSAGMKFTDVLTRRLVELLEFIDENKLIGEKRLGGLRFRIHASGKALLDVPHPYEVKVISMRGMLIESERRMEIEQCCPMELSLEEPTSVAFTGRVAFCAEIAEEGRTVYQMGIEFVELLPNHRERLDAFIRLLSASSA